MGTTRLRDVEQLLLHDPAALQIKVFSSEKSSEMMAHRLTYSVSGESTSAKDRHAETTYGSREMKGSVQTEWFAIELGNADLAGIDLRGGVVARIVLFYKSQEAAARMIKLSYPNGVSPWKAIADGSAVRLELAIPELRRAEEKKGRDEKLPAGSRWSGTGFLITDGGLILTNRHVVENGKTLLVRLSDETEKSAEVVVIDDIQDLALIRIKTDGKLPFVKFSGADTPPDGAECTVIGYPLRDRLGDSIKITRGIVSGSNDKESISGPDVILDVRVNPGNSGGPILDRHGNLMAIVSMKTRNSAFEDAFGLGISAGHIRKFLESKKVKTEAGKDGPNLSAEEIAALVKPATVCILGSN